MKIINRMLFRFIMCSIVIANIIFSAICPIAAYAAENITHNVWVDSNNQITVKPINGGEIIDGFCIDLDKVISGANSENNALKYEELQRDNPQNLFDLIVLSEAKLNRLPYKTPEEIFNYIKGVYYYGIVEGYTYKQIQDAIWEFTNGLYSNASFYAGNKKSEEGKHLYQKAVANPLNSDQLAQVHIRIFKYIRGRATPTQNVIHIDIDQPEVLKEKDVVISKVNLGGEEIAGAKIQILQGNKEVASWTSESGKSHELSLLPGDYVFHEEAAPKGYVVVTDITFTVNTDGSVTVKEANGNKVAVANNQLTVTDETEYVNPIGTLRTTVKVDNTTASATKSAEVTARKAATGVEITDTIIYEGLVPEKVYSVTGELYEVKEGQVVGTAKATTTKEFTVSKEGKGEWQLAFGQVTGLEAGKTYVVYETATSKENLVDKNKDNTPEEKHVVEHKNPGDKAQTVVVTPEVPKEKDIVISKVNLGGEEIAGAKIQILQGNKEVASWTSESGKSHELSLLPGDYVFHEEAAPKGYVVVTDITFTVNTDGSVTVKEANGNKVAVANNQLTVTDETEYVNPIGTLRTTVKVDNTTASATKSAEVTARKAATGVEITDTIIYEGLVPEKVYSVTGELYEVKEGQVVGTAKATTTKEFTVSKEGKGEWQLAFGQVTGLEAGKTYVVYETATSKENLVDKNKDNTPEEKHVVEHKNPGDKAQTVVVTPEVPKEKDMSEPANRVRSSSNTNSNTSLPKTGEKNNDALIIIGILVLLGVFVILVYKKKKL
ncbi:VaFE repeat-containing surface-anchored protein [Enterococcus faecalis]|uniref:VaFE repeat-containing surface-anchored protein n=1 Tax=Enterococcus faecalis TaxID=1351 RepID=UPI003CC50522